MSSIFPVIASLAKPQPAWGLLGSCFGAAGALPPVSNAVKQRELLAVRSNTFKNVPAVGVDFLHDDPFQQLSALANPAGPLAMGAKWRHVVPTPNGNSMGDSPMSSAISDCRSAAFLGVRDFKVSNVRRVADDYTEVTFVPADGHAIPVDFTPGQCLELHVDGGSPHRYVVTSAPGKDYLQCCVKSASDGLHLGTVVRLAAPCRVHHAHASQRPIVLISAGISSAATKAFLQSAPENVRFAVHIDRSESSHAFRREFRQSCIDVSFHYTSEFGRPSPEDLMKEIKPHLVDCDFFISGPATFVESMNLALKAAGARNILVDDMFGSLRAGEQSSDSE